MRLQLESTVAIDGQLRVMRQSGVNSIACAGGRHPISGSRSAFNASLRSFSLDSLKTEWEFTLEKSWPFSVIAKSGDLIFAGIQQNFNRAPCGFWGVDFKGSLSISKDLPASFQMIGGDRDLMVAIPDFDREIVSISQVYPSENPILTVPSTETNSVVEITAFPSHHLQKQVIVTVAAAGKKRVTYIHALYREGSEHPIWEAKSCNDKLCWDGDRIITYASEKQKEFEILSSLNGRLLDRIKFVDEGVQRLQIMQPGVWAVSRSNRQLSLFSISDGVHDTVSLATEHPGWLELCVTSDRERVVALNTDNFQGMKSKLSVFRAN